MGQPYTSMPGPYSLEPRRLCCDQPPLPLRSRRAGTAPPCLQLKIVDWHNVERASDALSINGYEHYQAKDYALEACYLSSNSRHDDRAKPSTPSRDFTKWWLDGEEPQYYLVSPKVPHPTGPCHSAEWGGKGARGWAARSVNK